MSRRTANSASTLWIASILSLAIFICFFLGSARTPSVTAIYGTLIDGTGVDPIANGVVVVTDERIVSIGSVADVVIPAGAREIRVTNATILPGFIDTHVHKAYDETTLMNWAASGVTTVRDLGWDPAADWDARRDELAMDSRLASLIIAGPLVTVPGGYGVTHGFPVAVTVSSPAEARAKIHALIQDGVDIIKIAIDSSMPLEFDAVMSVDIAAAIVEAAHEQNTPVIAHISNEADVLAAIEAGVDQIAHTGTGRRKIATIQSLVDHNIIWVTTLFPSTSTAHLRNFFGKGGVIALGTDEGAMGRVDATMPVEQLQRMLRLGIDAMSVIVASTANAALACGLENETGTLEEGKFADILVVAGDPLEDITILGEAAFVMHRGTVVFDESHAE